MNRRDNTTMGKLMRDLKALRPMLPKGYLKIIAERTGACEATVNNTMKGRTRRYDIISCAIDLAMESKSIAEKLDKVVNG